MVAFPFVRRGSIYSQQMSLPTFPATATSHDRRVVDITVDAERTSLTVTNMLVATSVGGRHEYRIALREGHCSNSSPVAFRELDCAL